LALKLKERALAIDAKVLGSEHLDTVIVRNNMADRNASGGA
jgi:hypothetical protein